MANFFTAYNITMAHEGGIANHVADSGKLTYKGIASAYWPNWAGWAYVRATLKQTGDKTAEQIAKANKILGADQTVQALVQQFYKVNFWNVYGLDSVKDQDIANEIFDTGVNMGVKVESKFLQRALNVTNLNERYFNDLVVDGAIGRITLAALNAHPNQKQVLKVLNILQGARYIEIAENDHTQEVFMNSWLSRVNLN